MELANSIAIIGAGSVGATTAFACLLKRVAASVLLVDINTDLAQAQVLDLQDATTMGGGSGQGAIPRIEMGTFVQAGQCNVIVITAGAKQRPGEARTSLIDRNHAIMQSIFTAMCPIRSDAVIIIVANPCDVLTCIAQKLSGLPATGQVFGSGTCLDSARLCTALSSSFGSIFPSSINAYVLGEHGDSQFVAWSCATIGNTPLSQFKKEYEALDKKAIALATKNKAYSIIEAKGATHFGIGAVVASLAEAVLFDTRSVHPVSHWIPELGCCLSLPAIVSRHGVNQTMPIVNALSAEERDQLTASANAIKAVLSSTSH